jgi:outer membrane protein, multidrug efflux system
VSRRLAWGRAVALGLILTTLASGCTLQPPQGRPGTLRTEAPVLRFDAPGADGRWPDAGWWRRYGDPTLDTLVERALADAPGVAVADARFTAAQQSIRAAGAALGVNVEASGDLARQRLSDNGLISPKFLGFNWYNQADLGIQVRYSFDWWGRQKAAIAAAVDEAHAVDAERAAARLVISAAVADAYFGWQADQQRLALARQELAGLQHLTQVTRQRVEAQIDNSDTLRMASVADALVREQLAGLEGSAQLRVVALAALLGRRADELPTLSMRPLPRAAGQLPARVTLDLMGRRPDIVASRWRVEAARQGMASIRAEYYPDISLNALAGLSSVQLGRLLQGGSAVPSLGAAIHLPLFDAGLRDARFAGSQAQLDAAVAAYDETVLAAAREVATAASSVQSLAAQREQREAQLVESRALAANAGLRVTAGTSDIRPQLLAELGVLTGQDGLIQLDLAAVSTDIALQRALGGGYLATETQP